MLLYITFAALGPETKAISRFCFLSPNRSALSHFRYGVRRGRDEGAASGCKLLASTVRLLSEKYQLLLLPITMFIGAEEAFVAVDFTAVSVAK